MVDLRITERIRQGVRFHRYNSAADCFGRRGRRFGEPDRIRSCRAAGSFPRAGCPGTDCGRHKNEPDGDSRAAEIHGDADCHCRVCRLEVDSLKTRIGTAEKNFENPCNEIHPKPSNL